MCGKGLSQRGNAINAWAFLKHRGTGLESEPD
jgi:hypothetical protein